MVTNIHERFLNVAADRIGALIDELASPGDRLWPCDRWPAMRFDRPLGIGAMGGHGPIRYVVERYSPGQSVWFGFTAPAGFIGGHGFELVEQAATTVCMRHRLEMRTRGGARLSWPLVYQPLHDALIEDALDRAEAAAAAKTVALRAWSWRVKFLRSILSGRGIGRK
jgi:hypothetical protein